MYSPFRSLFVVLSSLITFIIPFLVVFLAVRSAIKKQKGGRQASPRPRAHSHYRQGRPYDPTTNTADYPSACQAGYDPVRAKDQLDTLLKAGHLTPEEYRQRVEDLKNYRHC